MIASFEQWTKGRSLHSLSTNWKAESLPFQTWRNFKEAFAPELVARAVRESRLAVARCVDPFGGSGTTALACQFLGVHPTTVEVNPFLADLIAAKLCTYDVPALLRDFKSVLAFSRSARPGKTFWRNLGPTFVEPGVDDRWIFDHDVAYRIAKLLIGISSIRERRNKRLFKVLLGGILIEVSNVITSGKGRRYRRNWEERRCDADQVVELFSEAVESAIVEIDRYSKRQQLEHDVLLGDARSALGGLRQCELAVFSPPYPNSFDYTDVYNVELWMLGYLSKKQENRRLREATLSSHVQITREFAVPPSSSPILKKAIKQLSARRDDLWNDAIPEMVGAYFADMDGILRTLSSIIVPRGAVWMVVGDSQYAGVEIRVSAILNELARAQGWQVSRIEPFRSMRSSAQQGGEYTLGEDLVVLSKA